MKKIVSLFIVLSTIVLLTGCVPGDGINNAQDPAGFLWGVWHGLIIPFTFIGSLFSDNVTIYEVFNNGGWYNFGFILGIGITFGGSGASSR